MSATINPYSPCKVLCHHRTWQDVKRWCDEMEQGIEQAWLPTPITISFDPANKCNCHCIDCNADFVLQKSAQCMMSREYLRELAEFLSDWGVRGACGGGGGESTLNPHLGFFVEELKNYDIGVGIVSNGIALHHHPELELLDWLGVSVDSATPETWALTHGADKKNFNKILCNMMALINKGVHTTYKYLVRPQNTCEVYDAVKMADNIGCKYFHIRPMSLPWFGKPTNPLFTSAEVKLVQTQLEHAKQDFPAVDVIGVFSKVNAENWKVEHPFKKCHAIFATCVFQANKMVGTCCDNRGNPHFEVGPFEHPRDFAAFWGSRKHYDMMCTHCVDSCPRCTFNYWNAMYEQVIESDGFMLDFI